MRAGSVPGQEMLLYFLHTDGNKNKNFYCCHDGNNKHFSETEHSTPAFIRSFILINNKGVKAGELFCELQLLCPWNEGLLKHSKRMSSES